MVDFSSTLLGLSCNGSDTLSDLCQITQVLSSKGGNGVALRDRFHILIKFVNQGNTSRNIQFRDLIAGDSVQMLYKCTKSVTMCGNDNFLSTLDQRHHLLIPFYQEARFSQFQGFGQGQFVLWHILVHRIVSWKVFRRFVQWRRGDIVRSSPNQHLFLSVFFNCFLFVQALQSSIVTFIQSPSVDDGNVHEMQFFENNPQGFDGTLQCGSVSHIKGVSCFLQKFGTIVSFLESLLAQRAVVPTSKAILVIPCGFPVSDQDDSVLHFQACRRPGCLGESGRKWSAQKGWRKGRDCRKQG
mmetsp:Transcript_3420/g.6417  ORF Transcript_3420/g.6417 Transcript_3420/m.6417 type:complete len:298 (+) Transcript_3420:148-1041(+)